MVLVYTTKVIKVTICKQETKHNFLNLWKISSLVFIFGRPGAGVRTSRRSSPRARPAACSRRARRAVRLNSPRAAAVCYGPAAMSPQYFGACSPAANHAAPLRLIPLPSLALYNPITGGLNHYQTDGLRLIHIKFISFIQATQYSRYKLVGYRLLSAFH